MLKLSKKADYGLIAAGHLATLSAAGSCSAKEIAKAYDIPPQLLAKILQKLVKGGLLVSKLGANGGYALARDPALMSAFEVIRAIDGPLNITSCVTHRGECRQSPKCTVREPLHEVNDSIIRALSSLTISRVARQARKQCVGEPGAHCVEIDLADDFGSSASEESSGEN